MRPVHLARWSLKASVREERQFAVNKLKCIVAGFIEFFYEQFSFKIDIIDIFFSEENTSYSTDFIIPRTFSNRPASCNQTIVHLTSRSNCPGSRLPREITALARSNFSLSTPATSGPLSRNIVNPLLYVVSLSGTRKAARRRVYCNRTSGPRRSGRYVSVQAVRTKSRACTGLSVRLLPLRLAAIVITLLRSSLARANREIYRRPTGTPLEYPTANVPRHVLDALNLTRISSSARSFLGRCQRCTLKAAAIVR